MPNYFTSDPEWRNKAEKWRKDAKYAGSPADRPLTAKQIALLMIMLFVSGLYPVFIIGRSLIDKNRFRFPVFPVSEILGYFLLSIPFIAVLITAVIKVRHKEGASLFIIIIDLVLIPVTFIPGILLCIPGGFTDSKTDNVKNYLKLDDNFYIYEPDVFYGFFPGEADKDADYSYNMSVSYNGSDEIFYQPRLTPEQLISESSRIEDLFENVSKSGAKGPGSKAYELMTEDHGNYHCLILTSGGVDPFDEKTNPGIIDCYIFAYIPGGSGARYIYYSSQESERRLFYTDHDW